MIEALIKAAHASGVVPLELGKEPGVTMRGAAEIGSCLASAQERRQRQARDPSPEIFLSRIAFGADRQSAVVAVSHCGGGRFVLLNRKSDGWAAVGGLGSWDH
jgi:hypothetical protein